MTCERFPKGSGDMHLPNRSGSALISFQNFFLMQIKHMSSNSNSAGANQDYIQATTTKADDIFGEPLQPCTLDCAACLIND